jgi:hypothetical protein
MSLAGNFNNDAFIWFYSHDVIGYQKGHMAKLAEKQNFRSHLPEKDLITLLAQNGLLVSLAGNCNDYAIIWYYSYCGIVFRNGQNCKENKF